MLLRETITNLSEDLGVCNDHLLSLRSLSLNKRTRVRQQCDSRKLRAGDRNLATTCRQTLSRCYLETSDVTCASLPGELHGWVLVLLPTSLAPTPLPNSTVKLALGRKENLLALLISPPANPKYHQLEMPFGKRVTSAKKLWKRLLSPRRSFRMRIINKPVMTPARSHMACPPAWPPGSRPPGTSQWKTSP